MSLFPIYLSTSHQTLTLPNVTGSLQGQTSNEKNRSSHILLQSTIDPETLPYTKGNRLQNPSRAIMGARDSTQGSPSHQKRETLYDTYQAIESANAALGSKFRRERESKGTSDVSSQDLELVKAVEAIFSKQKTRKQRAELQEKIQAANTLMDMKRST